MKSLEENQKCLRRRYFIQEENQPATLPRAQTGAHRNRAFSLGGHRLLSLYRSFKVAVTVLKFDLTAPISSWQKYLWRRPGRLAPAFEIHGGQI
jgi:hypothetical protein